LLVATVELAAPVARMQPALRVLAEPAVPVAGDITAQQARWLRSQALAPRVVWAVLVAPAARHRPALLVPVEPAEPQV